MTGGRVDDARALARAGRHDPRRRRPGAAARPRPGHGRAADRRWPRTPPRARRPIPPGGPASCTRRWDPRRTGRHRTSARPCAGVARPRGRGRGRGPDPHGPAGRVRAVLLDQLDKDIAGRRPAPRDVQRPPGHRRRAGRARGARGRAAAASRRGSREVLGGPVEVDARHRGVRWAQPPHAAGGAAHRRTARARTWSGSSRAAPSAPTARSRPGRCGCWPRPGCRCRRSGGSRGPTSWASPSSSWTWCPAAPRSTTPSSTPSSPRCTPSTAATRRWSRDALGPSPGPERRSPRRSTAGRPSTASRCPAPVPLLDEAVAWLRRPPAPDRSGRRRARGPRTGQLPVGRTARIVALTDWEFVHHGDAAEDWAYLAIIRGRKLGPPEWWYERIERIDRHPPGARGLARVGGVQPVQGRVRQPDRAAAVPRRRRDDPQPAGDRHRGALPLPAPAGRPGGAATRDETRRCDGPDPAEAARRARDHPALLPLRRGPRRPGLGAAADLLHRRRRHRVRGAGASSRATRRSRASARPRSARSTAAST